LALRDGGRERKSCTKPKRGPRVCGISISKGGEATNEGNS